MTVSVANSKQKNATKKPNEKPNEKPLKRPPTMSGNLLFGVMPEFQRDPLGLYMRAMREFGPVVRMRFGPFDNYAISHPDDIQHILVDNNRNYKRNTTGNQLLKIVSGENLVTSDGDYWRKQRRLMQPAFHRRHITAFGQMMTNHAEKMLARWEAESVGQLLDIDQEMMAVTLNIVGEALFSVDLSSDVSGLGNNLTASSEYFAYRLQNVFAPPLWVPTRRNRAFKKSRVTVNHIAPKLITERRKLHASGGERPHDLMDMLIEARYEGTDEGMSDEQLQAEIMTMIGAGHETTANSLSWTLYLLSQHPEIEAKLHAEVDRVLEGRTPTMDDLKELSYTRMILEESMRLYPPAWGLARQSIEADELSGYEIPADASVIFLCTVLHRHPDFWSEPDIFDPERFLPERSKDRHRFAYLPFGAGPRQCIGNLFAMSEAQLILSMVAQRYRLTLRPGHKVEPLPLVALRVKNGLPMTLHRRTV